MPEMYQANKYYNKIEQNHLMITWGAYSSLHCYTRVHYLSN